MPGYRRIGRLKYYRSIGLEYRSSKNLYLSEFGSRRHMLILGVTIEPKPVRMVVNMLFELQVKGFEVWLLSVVTSCSTDTNQHP